ncbi:hypothetical protein [Oceanobacillus halotolerans]|nr:hypothetical protein [Oceanobacillus halotolerans]
MKKPVMEDEESKSIMLVGAQIGDRDTKSKTRVLLCTKSTGNNAKR